MKKTISISDIFVKKICDKLGQLITKDEILKIWTLSGGSKSRMSYALSILVGRKIIENLAKGLYRIKNEESKIKTIDEDYWNIIEKLISLYSPSGGVIGGEKSIELHLQNYSVPDTLIIYTRDTAQRIKLKNGREIHFRVLISGEKTGGKNIFRILESDAITIKGYKDLMYLSREGALLDALSLRRHDTGIEESSILRFLKSFHTSLSREKLGNLVRYRYIRAINRLRGIAQLQGYDELYKKTLDTIRDEGGGCFVSL